MNGKVAYAEIDGFQVVRLEGDVRFSDVTALHRFINNRFESGSAFIIDLTHCEYLDSTALGVLALIAKISGADRANKPCIYVSSHLVKETLLGVCFDMIFEIVTCQNDLEGKYRSVDDNNDAYNDVKTTIISAHQALASISRLNTTQFCDVNELLKLES